MSTIFITGANRGIGLSLVKRYLQEGNTVYATYRNKANAQSLLSLKQANPNLTCLELEITDYQSVSSLVSELGNIDILINNAGYYGPKGYGLSNVDVE